MPKRKSSPSLKNICLNWILKYVGFQSKHFSYQYGKQPLELSKALCSDILNKAIDVSSGQNYLPYLHFLFLHPELEEIIINEEFPNSYDWFELMISRCKRITTLKYKCFNSWSWETRSELAGSFRNFLRHFGHQLKNIELGTLHAEDFQLLLQECKIIEKVSIQKVRGVDYDVNALNTTLQEYYQSSLNNLSNLKVFEYKEYHGMYPPDVPVIIFSLPNLESLMMPNYKLPSEIPEHFIPGGPNLNHCSEDIDNRPLTPSRPGDSPHQFLKITELSIKEGDLLQINSLMPNIEKLKVEKYFGGLPVFNKLTVLDTDDFYNDLNVQYHFVMKNFLRLRVVNMAVMKSEIFMILEKCCELQKIRFVILEGDVSVPRPEALKHKTKLTDLEIRVNDVDDFTYVEQILLNSPFLEYVRLSTCIYPFNVGFITVGRCIFESSLKAHGFQKLQSIFLHRTLFIPSVKTMYQFLQRESDLKEICFRECFENKKDYEEIMNYIEIEKLDVTFKM